MPPLAVLFFVWAGFLILLSGANPGLYAKGQEIFKNTFYGIIILLSAWMITNTLILSVGAKYNNAGNWWQFVCTEPAPVSPPVVPPPGQPPGQPPPTGPPVPNPTGNCTGVSCSDSNLKVCGQETSANCSESAVNQWDSQIRAAAANNQIGSGINTVALIKAIISQESGGRTNINASDGLSYGIMQLRPTTANSFKSGCTSADITPAWLNDSNNVQASVCIAINYLKSLVGSCGTSVRNLSAGYNGGGAAKGACDFSQSCASCSACGNERTRRWECLWDGPDGEHRVCNVDRSGSSFNATRRYVPRVSYCYTKFGGSVVVGPPAPSNLVVSSFSPTTVSAGTEKSFNQQTGVVEYAYLEVPLQIQGQGLTGATFSSNNTGVDGRPGIEFKNIQISDTSITGTMLVHSTAKDGNTSVTVRNSGGQTATKDVSVTITGTQYLKRKFADNPKISFRGNWREVMPNGTIVNIESAIKRGLDSISGSNYTRLDINSIIYEQSFFNSVSVCGSESGDGVVGCASPVDKNIHIMAELENGLPGGLSGVFLHESAHKLHFFNLGQYRGISNFPTVASGFQRDWDSFNVVTPSNMSACSYMPLLNFFTWKDQTTDVPKCVFVRAYGASLLEGDRIFYEDPTTYAQAYYFDRQAFDSNSEIRSNSKYMSKVGVLKRYGFLP